MENKSLVLAAGAFVPLDDSGESTAATDAAVQALDQWLRQFALWPAA